jgi:hypothetical protein
MYSKEEIKKLIIKLHELADIMHPHMKGDNHTRTLINKAFSDEKLSADEAFDCGKYYNRMLELMPDGSYLSSILQFKYAASKNKK